jgi:hypothetical protein
MEKPPSLSLVKRDASSAYPLDLHVSSLSADTTAPSTPEEGDAVAVTDDSSPLAVSRLNSSSDAFLCNSSSPPAEEENTSFANHGDPLYASLIAAQQLRRQRDATEGGLSATTAALVSPVQPSLVFNSSLTAIDASQSPRTLQDLLTWRQNMLETRMREHARQDSADPSWSVNSPAVRNEAFTRSTWSAGLLTPQTPPTPCTVLNSQSPLPHERRHTHTTEAGEGEKGEKGSCPEAALHHAASPGSAAHPSSHPASSGMPSRTASHLLDVTPHTPTSEEIYEMVHIHDIGVGHAIFARIGLSLLLLLVLSLIYDAPFLPGGGWALL